MDWKFVKDCGKLHYPKVMSRKGKTVKELEEAVDDLDLDDSHTPLSPFLLHKLMRFLILSFISLTG